MFTTKERDRTKIFIVVLDGPKVLREKSGVAPLSYALRQVVQPDDEVVVLVIFNSGDLTHTPVISSCCIRTDGRNHQPNNERDIFITKLREEISQGTEGYMRIFRPFHRECKNIGVKFEAKIVIGPTLTAIISEEKLNTGATSVVIGRSFAAETVPCTSRKNCKFTSMFSEDEEMILYTCNPLGESSGVKTEGYRDQKPSKYKKKQSSNNEVKPIYHILPNFEGIYQPSSSSSSIGSTSEPQQETEDFEKFKDHFVEISNTASSSSTSRGLEFLVELSWEVISEITDRFKNIINVSSNEAFQVYRGYFEDISSAVFVKRFVGNHFNYVLEAEKKAALSMYHKNIVRLLGFHQNENAMALVFPYASRGSLMDRFLNGFWTKELEIDFADKMKIVIGIAQGLRYMHEQCPRGPIVHGDLRACNVLLGHNLEPQARPLLAQRAYHILYDESEHDFHGLLVVTTAATRCISTRWKSRPCMSQVLSLLKGEISCAEQTFPSTESSPAANLSPDSNVWLRSNESSSIMALTPDSNLWVV
ncbi:unnamed protein product [Lactuca saligna]|uniref:Protein kinase domain-containing protein n=1 Tax=Lactuca saligna TaxID=75948 RepID=A0AA36E7G5_LACSI|nr:unnamed protein product [Lactuca saligna]